jgi:tetratricopeptide (TPR) repeat protein
LKHSKKPVFDFRGGWGFILILLFLSACTSTNHTAEDPSADTTSQEVDPWLVEIQQAQAILDDPLSERADYITGLDHMATAVVLGPDSIVTYTLYSELYLKTGRIRDGILILEKALERDVHNAESLWSRIAHLYDVAGSAEAAIASYEQAILSYPNDQNLQNGYINVLIRADRLDEARYQLSIRNEPHLLAKVLYKLAERRLEQADSDNWLPLVDEAEALMTDAAEADVIYAAMMTSNLVLLYQGEDESIPADLYSRAIGLLETVSESTEQPETVWSLLLDLYTTVGDETKAAQARLMLSLDPSY